MATIDTIAMLCPLDGLALLTKELIPAGDEKTEVGEHLHRQINQVPLVCALGHEWLMSGDVILERTK